MESRGVLAMGWVRRLARGSVGHLVTEAIRFALAVETLGTSLILAEMRWYVSNAEV